MRCAWLLPALVIACTHAAAPPPIGNTGGAATPTPGSAACVVAGELHDATGLAMAGATLVASWPGAGDDPPVEIADEDGHFSFGARAIPRPATLTIYYNDSTFQSTLPRCQGALRLTVDLDRRGDEVGPIIITSP